jgi:hypothetical protein
MMIDVSVIRKDTVLWYAVPDYAILKVLVLEDYQWEGVVLTTMGMLPVSGALFTAEISARSWCNFALGQRVAEAREALQRAEEAMKSVTVLDLTSPAVSKIQSENCKENS